MANPDVQQEFMANPEKQRRPKAVRKPLPKSTPEQKELNDRWKFIRSCFLLSQLRTDGFYSCMECGVQCEHTYELDLDHILRRDRNNYTPDNAQLLCNARSRNRRNNCHDRKSGTQPIWSGA